MIPARRAHLESTPTAQLTDTEVSQGWRLCAERDGHLANVSELRDCVECTCLGAKPRNDKEGK